MEDKAQALGGDGDEDQWTLTPKAMKFYSMTKPVPSVNELKEVSTPTGYNSNFLQHPLLQLEQRKGDLQWLVESVSIEGSRNIN